MIRYAVTIFLSAFLLFQVQPLVARFILPWFGGSSLVWTTCMLFFQSALVVGYAYSHFVNRHLNPLQQWLLHSALLVVAVLFLPVHPSDYWKPPNSEIPTLRILALLGGTVGLPFFLLSTTGPLIQAWQSRTHPLRSPFRLFALSNLASLLALISYPFLFERFLTVETQSWTWSVAFAGFAAMAIYSGRLFYRRFPHARAVAAVEKRKEPDEIPRIRPLRIALWLVLPMLASIQLLATTNLMTQEIGSVPFLWILPLSLYLLSFIICFDHNRWYVRPVFFGLLFAAAIYSGLVLEAGVEAPINIQIFGYSLVCFAASMCCHGELARSKPVPERLTLFYLMVALGGALGGVFVAIIAPHLFAGFYEFQLGLILAIICCLVAYGMQVQAKTQDTHSRFGVGKLGLYAVTLFAGLLTTFFVCTSFAATWLSDNEDNILVKTRNEYGTLTVKDYADQRQLNNGRIEHGFQSKDDWMSLEPASYYGPTSGLGIAIEFLREQKSAGGEPGDLDFGVIGLGVGTVCAWCQPNDTIRYFEINPAVERIAKKYFTYLEGCATRPEIVLGDARLQLEFEILRDDPRQYDVLIADAFSSDSIPIHLLTLEALEIYRQRTKPNGVICIHTSNRFLYLENIVKVLAAELGMDAVLVDDDPDGSLYNSSNWVLVTNNESLIQHVKDQGLDHPWPNEKYTARWTDNYASLLPVIHWDDEDRWYKDVLEEKGWVKKAEADD